MTSPGQASPGRSEAVDAPPADEADPSAPNVPGDAREVQQLHSELAATRAALAETERELFELRERRSDEMARLERQVYWIERSRIDLDRLMQRPLARVAFELLRLFVRALRRLAGRRA